MGMDRGVDWDNELSAVIQVMLNILESSKDSTLVDLHLCGKEEVERKC